MSELFLDLGDERLEAAWHGPRAGSGPVLVLLHEGLGSVSAWRDFPARLAAELALPTLVYSRRGYGRSDPLAGPLPLEFMHDEARRVLPRVLAAAGVREAILVGHSDGGSIALIRAGDGAPEVCALVLEAPHVFVEDETVQSIARLRGRASSPEVLERFARHHGANARPLLEAWTGAWLDPAFRSWNIEASLPGVRCPVLVIQGERDEYGTLAQVRAIDAQVGGPCESVILADCGHSPHRDRPEETLAAMAAFVRRVLGR